MTNQTKYLCERLHEHFPNAEIQRIEGVGWDPVSHVHADIRVNDRMVSLFLKRLRPETQDAEQYAYTKLLPVLEFHTPHLYGAFPDREPSRSWLILERVEGKPIELSDTQLNRGLFEILGQLHGRGQFLVAEENIPEHLRFFSTETEKSFAKWNDLLARDMNCLSLDARALEIFNARLKNLREAPCTWVHGDLETSNLLHVGPWIYVIDWESCGFGPASLDLGPVVARLPGDLLLEYMDAYCRTYTHSSGESLSQSQVQEWIDDGLVIDAVEWIAHYCEHRDEPGWRNWTRFYHIYVLPRVKTLNVFSARTHHPA